MEWLSANLTRVWLSVDFWCLLSSFLVMRGWPVGSCVDSWNFTGVWFVCLMFISSLALKHIFYSIFSGNLWHVADPLWWFRGDVSWWPMPLLFHGVLMWFVTLLADQWYNATLYIYIYIYVHCTAGRCLCWPPHLFKTTSLRSASLEFRKVHVLAIPQCLNQCPNIATMYPEDLLMVHLFRIGVRSCFHLVPEQPRQSSRHQKTKGLVLGLP